jgi:CubicO group peptidase (beta-lactamase class C family)
MMKFALVALLLLGLAGRTLAGEATNCLSFGLSHCPQPWDQVLPAAADMLTWDQDSRVIGFRNGWRLYPGDVFKHGAGSPLPAASQPLPQVSYAMDGKTYRLTDYLRRQSVTGLLILKDGKVAMEYYAKGNGPYTLWTSRSVAKSVVSILVGIAIKEGLIHSTDDPLTVYLPELAGTAWQDVTLGQALQHGSGVVWNEDYKDPQSDFSQLTRCEANPGPYECILSLVKSVARKPGVAPGEVWSYNTGGAWLVGRVLERASSMSIAKFLETRLWQRYPMEADGVWQSLVKDRIDMGGHGFNASLRDWGRFGLFVAQGGRLPSGEMLLPTDWLERSTRWSRAAGSVSAAAPEGQYGYQWWFGGVDPKRPGSDRALRVARESLWAEGIFGQTIAIDPKRNLVMVQWSTWPEADNEIYDEEQSLFFSALADAYSTGVR